MPRTLMPNPVAEKTALPLPSDFEPIAAPTHDEIAQEAYAIYIASGYEDGRDVEHWLEAEQALLDRRAHALRG